ncbi:MAG: glycosyltransferase [Goleter apudmare HA4340-LM2]|jgi:GT2 family glycosyltransferase|nr:glycosyltransferase [Goleter apudmare HA4340-LM2]
MNSTHPNGRDTSIIDISVIVPVHKGGENFCICLSKLSLFLQENTEIIVVIDGHDSDSWQLAQSFPFKVIKITDNGGPARARNLGASLAKGEILFFIDADVTINPDTLNLVAQTFANQPDLVALIGSYDDTPGATNFLSQYKNLFHHYTHQSACEEASTFWGACGAIRREIFLAVGGFNQTYRYPSVEDIELGYRLKQQGYRIHLCKTLQVKHLKHWNVVSLLKAEIFYRALPWTELLWQYRQFINDLNLKQESRISVVLIYGILIFLLLAWWWWGGLMIAGVFSLVLLLLNLSLYRFFHQHRGLWFAICTIPWHWFYFFYSGLAFATGTIIYHLKSNLRTKKAAFP